MVAPGLAFVVEGDVSLGPAASPVKSDRRRLPIGLGQLIEGLAGSRPLTGRGHLRDGIAPVHHRDPQCGDFGSGLGERQIRIGPEAKTPPRAVRSDIAEFELFQPGWKDTNPEPATVADGHFIDLVSGFQGRDLAVRAKLKAGHHALSSRLRCKSNATQTSIFWGTSGADDAEFPRKSKKNAEKLNLRFSETYRVMHSHEMS